MLGIVRKGASFSFFLTWEVYSVKTLDYQEMSKAPFGFCCEVIRSPIAIHGRPGASPHISGWGGGGRISAVSFGSDQWNDMCFYGTDKYVNWLRSIYITTT